MATEFRIAVELSELIGEGTPVTRELFPTLAYAVKAIAEEAQRRWVAYASGAPLPGGKVIRARTGEYARSIMLRQEGDFAAEVYSDLPYAHVIEEGAPERDLKRMLGYSYKVREGAGGKRYLIIPFRWNHPNSVLGHQMPQAVHDWWRRSERKPSAIIGTYRRLSGTGAYDIHTRERLTVPGWRYRWGERLTKGDLTELGITGAPARRLVGMVNFRKPAGRPGYGQHSQFITFRTMHEDSKGWVVPPREGLWPARTVADDLRPVAEEAFRRAVEEDVRRALGGAEQGMR